MLGLVVTVSSWIHVSSPDGLVCLSAHAFLLLLLPGWPDATLQPQELDEVLCFGYFCVLGDFSL